MNIRLTKGTASTRHITAISSKSYVHRLIIAASLYGGNTGIITNIMSTDMRATADAINALGGDVKVEAKEDGGYEIVIGDPLGKDHIAEAVIDCRESGSTARFILPSASVFADRATLTGSGALPKRPMGPLCSVLRKAGVTVSGDHLPITVSGMPAPGDYSIAGDVSSQFISGLLFMLPLTGGTSSLEITGRFESAAYAAMTTDVLRKFGADIEYDDRIYHIKGTGSGRGKSVLSGGKIRAEGDWSNAAYIMAMASLAGGTVFSSFGVKGLDPGSIQGDRAVTGILKDFGISVSYDETGGSYEIKGRPVRGVDTDCSQIPDLVPALAVLAAYAEGDSIFRNVGRLRIKESDRVEAVKEMLAALNVEVDIISRDGSEDMTVHGKGPDRPVSSSGHIVIDSHNDHRIAMAAAAAAFAETVPVVITDAMATDKSYPGFYDAAKMMGLSCSTVDSGSFS